MSDRDDEVINVSYTNWRGETKIRRVLLGPVRFGTTDWHKEPTWLISAFDLDHPAQIWKEFDLTKCDFNRDYMPDEIERLRACLEHTRDEICEGPVDEVLWHDSGTTTVDNITLTLHDGWTYDGWSDAKSTQA